MRPQLIHLLFNCYVLSLLIVTAVHCNLIRRKRLSHATNAAKNAWPSQVLILIDNEYYLTCGGSIINEAWILTAAHCVPDINGTNPMTYKLVFGEHNRQIDDGTEIKRNIAKIIRYPKYEMEFNSFDIALIRMDIPLDFNDKKQQHLKPICLDLHGINVTDKRCIATGFGRTGPGNAKMADILQQLEMQVADTAKCGQYFRDFLIATGINKFPEMITENQICFVSKENPYFRNYDSHGGGCAGDSGGPIQCQVNGQWFQVGILWATTDCERHPTAFNLVHQYADFIQEVTGYVLPDYCSKT